MQKCTVCNVFSPPRFAEHNKKGVCRATTGAAVMDYGLSSKWWRGRKVNQGCPSPPYYSPAKAEKGAKMHYAISRRRSCKNGKSRTFLEMHFLLLLLFWWEMGAVWKPRGFLPVISLFPLTKVGLSLARKMHCYNAGKKVREGEASSRPYVCMLSSHQER